MNKPPKVKSLRSSRLCLTPHQWLTRRIDPPDMLLGDLFSTTSRMLLSADTGIGKTMLAIGWAFAIGLGRQFLHWQARRHARVLYIDGEMPRDLLQERVALALQWFAVSPEEARRISILSTEDAEDMPPLDTPDGQRWLDRFIDTHGPFDFIIFDNIMSLCAGVMKEEESWQNVKEYTLSLTRRRIGQLWLHHTGHDKSRAYGTKTREWQMDTVMVAEPVSTTHVGFNLRFTKARRRKPVNATNFADCFIEYKDGRWLRGGAAKVVVGRKNKSEEIALRALQDLNDKFEDGVSEGTWRKRAYELRISGSEKDSSRRRAFQRAAEALVKSGQVSLEANKYTLVSEDN